MQAVQAVRTVTMQLMLSAETGFGMLVLIWPPLRQQQLIVFPVVLCTGCISLGVQSTLVHGPTAVHCLLCKP